MSNRKSAWTFVAAAALVVIIGIPFGYFLSGKGNDKSVVPSLPQDLSTPSASSSDAKQPATAGESVNYTAEGAPRMQITEEPVDHSKRSVSADSQPSAFSVSTAPSADQAVQPSADSENSQQSDAAGQPAVPNAPGAGGAPNPSDAAPAHSDPSSATPQSPSSPVADQTGTPAGSDDQSTLFKVLVGASYASEKSALVLVSDLRHKGYMATTSKGTGKNGVVYHVQVGAYHNRLTAENFAEQLQQNGYAARVISSK
jgi:cell division septation protein DedD